MHNTPQHRARRTIAASAALALAVLGVGIPVVASSVTHSDPAQATVVSEPIGGSDPDVYDRSKTFTDDNGSSGTVSIVPCLGWNDTVSGTPERDGTPFGSSGASSIHYDNLASGSGWNPYYADSFSDCTSQAPASGTARTQVTLNPQTDFPTTYYANGTTHVDPDGRAAAWLTWIVTITNDESSTRPTSSWWLGDSTQCTLSELTQDSGDADPKILQPGEKAIYLCTSDPADNQLTGKTLTDFKSATPPTWFESVSASMCWATADEERPASCDTKATISDGGTGKLADTPITVSWNGSTPLLSPSSYCGVDGKVVWSDLSEGMNFTKTTDGTVVTVTFHLWSGYTLTGTSASKISDGKTWVFDIASTRACTIVTPTAPTLVTSDTCGVESTVTVPAAGDGVAYSKTVDGKTVTVTAKLANQYDYKLAAGATTSWTFDTTAATSCVTPTAPTLVASDTCGVDSTVTVPADGDGVTYQKTVDGQTTTVTATAADGFGFAEGVKTVWTFDTSPAITCATPVPPVKIVGAAGVESTIDIPTVPGVHYALKRSGDIVTVTATPLDGFGFPADVETTEWTFNVAAAPAATESPEPTPSATPTPSASTPAPTPSGTAIAETPSASASASGVSSSSAASPASTLANTNSGFGSRLLLVVALTLAMAGIAILLLVRKAAHTHREQ